MSVDILQNVSTGTSSIKEKKLFPLPIISYSPRFQQALQSYKVEGIVSSDLACVYKAHASSY